MNRKIFIAVAAVLLAIIPPLALIRCDIPVEELKKTYANGSSRFVSVDGTDVHYRDEGNGFPLVLVHGTAASLHTWDGWASALSGDFRVIRMDLPAFGLTGPAPDRDYRVGAYVRFLDAFLDTIGVKRCHLAGNSLGGFIAWNYVLAHPDKVEKLILVDAAGYPSRAIPGIFRLVRLPLAGFLGRHIGPRFLIERNIREVYGDDSKITPVLVDRYHRLALREGNRQAFIDRARTDEDYGSLARAIPEIRVPTLIIWGKEDAWIPLENAHLFERDLPNSVLKIYDGVGHVPMEEIPDITARDTRRFLHTRY